MSAGVGPYGTERSTFAEAVDAEWAKIRTVRSTWWTLLALAVVGVGLTAAVSAGVAAEIKRNGVTPTTEPSGFLTFGMFLAQIAALVLGAMAMSSEYASGLIRSTLTAMPRRLTILLAKALVLAGILFAVGTAVAWLSFLAGNAFFRAANAGVELGDPGVLRSLFGAGLYLAVLGLFGLALATLLRHTAGAITVGLAVIFVLGNLATAIPGKVGEWLYKLMPGNAGSQITAAGSGSSSGLGPWAGFAVMCAEVAVLLALGAWLFHRRDA